MRGKFDWILYLGQLLPPGLITADILGAWHAQPDAAYRPFSDKAVLAACGLWMAVVLAPMLFSSQRYAVLRRLRTAVLALWAIYFCLMASEIALRTFFVPKSGGAALRPPKTRSEFRPSNLGIPVPGVSTFSVNEIGLRGPSEPARVQGTYKIITIGNSTTEDEAQDDTREWSHLLMEELNEKQSNSRVWVANAGVSGHTTVDNLAVMQALPVFSRVDAVILVLGQTDMGATLTFHGAPTDQFLEQGAASLRRSILARGVAVFDRPYYKESRLYIRAKQTFGEGLKRLTRETAVSTQVPLWEWRRRRTIAPILPLPDLSIGLAEYRQRITRLASQCETLHVRCIFATQPTLWCSTLNKDEQALLWGGRLGPWDDKSAGYLSAADLEKAMNAWNDALLQVCADKHLECFDLAARIPKTTEAFYDDSHSTDRGAAMYADQLAAYLLAKPPFEVRWERNLRVLRKDILQQSRLLQTQANSRSAF
ncbi:MAG TPA: GDSL-type esterase/lipase family protein [Candidatus Acidoferrum sp.]|nr:GDSL-type esterase/lipase family protein [Candidatus Acidoferrum sp.]